MKSIGIVKTIDIDALKDYVLQRKEYEDITQKKWGFTNVYGRYK